MPPLHVIDDYDYNNDNDDFNRLVRVTTVWYGVSDILRGIFDTTVGNFTVSQSTNQCWLKNLELYDKVYKVMPYAFEL